EPAQEPAAPTTTESSTDSGGWAVAAIPQGDTAPTPDVETARKPAPKAGAKQGPNPDAKAKPAAKAKPDADATPKPVSKDESPAKSTSKPETPDAAPKTAPPSGSRSESGAKQRYGEAVVREILGANFIEEKTVAPRVTPTQEG
ncbi:MAG TPA: hypothetical protein PKI99_08005, partial [Terrimesophilobacter sp.]|nr:hypothetical protein [Terrimesophilobacter sp.]